MVTVLLGVMLFQGWRFVVWRSLPLFLSRWCTLRSLFQSLEIRFPHSMMFIDGTIYHTLISLLSMQTLAFWLEITCPELLSLGRSLTLRVMVLMLCVLCWGGAWTDLWEEWLLASVTTRYLLFQLIACRSVVRRIRCRGILIWISVTTRFSQMKRPCLWKTSSSFHWWSNKLLCIRVTTRFACLCGIVQFPFPTTVHWHCKGWRAWKRSSGPVIFSRENMSALWMISLWRVMPVRSLLMRYIGMMGFCGTYHIMVLYIPGRTNWELF